MNTNVNTFRRMALCQVFLENCVYEFFFAAAPQNRKKFSPIFQYLPPSLSHSRRLSYLCSRRNSHENFVRVASAPGGGVTDTRKYTRKNVVRVARFYINHRERTGRVAFLNEPFRSRQVNFSAVLMPPYRRGGRHRDSINISFSRSLKAIHSTRIDAELIYEMTPFPSPIALMQFLKYANRCAKALD